MNEQEIQKHLETATQALDYARAKHEESHKEILGKTDEFVKSASAAADALEKAQEVKQHQAALENEVKEMQKLLARGFSASSDETENAERTNKIVSYLRKGTRIDSTEIEHMCREVAHKAVFGNDQAEIERLTKDLAVGSNNDGGFWLMPQRSSKIIKQVFETTPMRMLADIQTTSNDSLQFIVDDDQAACGWVGEVQARPSTATPKIGEITIPVHELYANPQATQKMLDDAGFDIEGWLTSKIADKFSRTENTAFVLGDDPKQPRGFNSYADASDVDTYQFNAIGTLSTAASNAIAGDDLIKLQAHLKEDYQTNAKWLMNRQMFINVATLKDLENRYIFQTYFLDSKLNQMLLGKEIVFSNDLPYALADNDLAIAYADWKQAYTIVDRYGIRVIRDPYTNKPYVLFYSTKRTGGAVTGFDAIKRLKIKA